MSLDQVTGEVRLASGRQSRVLMGSLWVFAGEIGNVTGNPEAGDLVDVRLREGRFCGRGLYNPRSKIRVRLLTTQAEPINDVFWTRRIENARALRRRVVADTTAYRVIFGEADLLPGLIVDRYGEVLVLQALSYGMDRRKAYLVELLRKLIDVEVVYQRNDAGSRALEGLPVEVGFLAGHGPTTVEIREGCARFLVDIERGQKTGWFCDQRENRLAAAALARDADVLDVFCHTAAFGIQAALHGARSVVGLDSSAEATAWARVHADLNGVGERCQFRQVEAFEELPKLERKGNAYDLVILDPPAFAKSRRTAGQALAGYKEINLRALRLIRPDGFLVTCSCSYHVSESALWDTIVAAARDARRSLRLVEARSQARDHPVLAAMPETRYLKCFLLQVL